MSKQLYQEIEKKQAQEDFFIEINTDACWWASLSSEHILELAFLLSQNALPVWEKYDFFGKIENQLHSVRLLPARALKGIGDILIRKRESADDKHLNNFFTSFVTPVIQFRDGDLNLPYEVKSAFLSVFDILKGMLSVRNPFLAVRCFSSSITRSMDAIVISNLLTNKEISMLTQKYLLLTVKGLP
ncbi:MAG: hypothetical protein ABI237_12565 [Ginsengibacter sp.]